MPEQFLYQQLDTLSQWGSIEKEVPDSVARNLNPKYELRPYQIEAFARFFHCYRNDFPNKTYPLHLLFNMATGAARRSSWRGLFSISTSRAIEISCSSSIPPTSSKRLKITSLTLQALNTYLIQIFLLTNGIYTFHQLKTLKP